MPKLCDYLGPFEAMNSQQSRGVFLPGSLVWRFHSYAYASYIVGMVYIYIYASCMDDVLE